MTDVNANVTACLVTKSHVGYDTFVNICSGVSKDVPWTTLDWCGAGFLAFAGLTILTSLVAVIAAVVWVIVDNR